MDELVSAARTIGIEISQKQQSLFEQLLEELKAYNAHTNLTAIRNDQDIIIKHFLDSLTVLQAIHENTKSLVDIGTGAGFPGFPIAIMRQDIKVTLVESVGKKTTFHQHIIEKLGLKNVETLNARAEDLAHNKKYREQFDVACARAVAELRVLSEFVLPFVKTGGIFVAQKSANTDEIDTAQNAIQILGGTITQSIPITLQALPDRQLIIIEKVKQTPEEYPRGSGLPMKKPL